MIIFAYHNVLEHTPGAFHMLTRKESTAARAFEKQIDDVAARLRVVPLAELARATREGRTMPDACAITFDDGGLGGYRYAAALLEKRTLPATFFLVTNRPGRDVQDAFDRLEALLWLTKRDALDLSASGEGVLSLACDECKVRAYGTIAKRLRVAGRAERDRLLETAACGLDVPESDVTGYLSHEAYQSMTWAQARELAQRGFAIGSHTRTHVSASALSEPELEDEIGGSYRDIVEQIGQNPREIAFAYPFGKEKHISEAAVDAARKAGYMCAVIGGGVRDANVDVFRLPRTRYKYAKKVSRGSAAPPTRS